MKRHSLRAALLAFVAAAAPALAWADNVAQIGETGYETLAAAVAAAAEGQTVSIVAAGTYTVPAISKSITVQSGVDGVVFDCTGTGNIADVSNTTFKGITFNMGQNNYHGFFHDTTINMEDCTFNGKFFSYHNMNFTNCQFVQTSSDYHMWIYGTGTVTFTGCTFTNNVTGKFLHLYNEGANTGNVIVKGCKFINKSGTASKAAINVKATCGTTALSYTLTVEDSEVDGAFPEVGEKGNADNTNVLSALVQVDDRNIAASEEKITVELDNVVVYEDGATVEVIEIGTVSELQALRDAVNNSNTSYAGKIVRLTADLDLSSVSNWEPIGNVASYPSKSFSGTFDGNGKTISGLTVDDQTVNWGCAGLFGSITNGSIANLTLTNVNIQSHHYAGGIVAYKGDGTSVSIKNCHVIGGTITSTPELQSGGSYDNGDKVGGILGYAANPITIYECSVKNVTLTAYRDLGGVAGYTGGGTVEDCEVSEVALVQDNTNGYKSGDMSSTVGEVVGGRSANASTINSDDSSNTTENVTITTRTQTCVSVGSTGFATFSSTEALDFTDVKKIYAYIATLDNDELTYTRITKVPANTGLLLRNPEGAAAATVDVPVLAQGEAEAESTMNNQLVAVSTDIASLASEADGKANYILNNGTKGVGFYRANGKKVAAGKAYLQVEASTNVKAFNFDADDATGIMAIEIGEPTIGEGDSAYNLVGQKIGRNMKHGIYIVNGKKILK